MATATLNPVLTTMSGTIGRMVFYTRNGQTVMRAYIIPPNPNTPAQSKNRDRFRQAMASWRHLPDEEKASYNLRARRLGMTGHNLFISRYMKASLGEKLPGTMHAVGLTKDNHGGFFLNSSSPSPLRRGGWGGEVIFSTVEKEAWRMRSSSPPWRRRPGG